MNARPADSLKIALAQLNPTVGDVAGNAEKVRRARDEAKAQGADLVAFPELFIAGYPPEDLVLKPAFQSACRTAIEALAHVDATSRSAVVISQSDDLAYVWGEMQSALGKHGNWARVWIRNPEGWRVLLDWNDLPQAR